MNERRNVTIWSAPDMNYRESYREKKYDDLIRVACENYDLIRELRKSKTEELKQSTRLGMLLLSYFERSIEKTAELYSVYLLGRLRGILGCVDDDDYVTQQNKLSEKRVEILATKYLEEVLSLLERYGSLSQTEVGEKLKLQKSTLSEALKRIRETGLVYVNEYGRFKVYRLTDEGVRYARILRNRNYYQPDVEKNLETLEYNLHSAVTKDCTIVALKELLRKEGYTIISQKEVVRLQERNGAKFKFRVETFLEECNSSSTILVGKRMEVNELQSICNNERIIS